MMTGVGILTERTFSSSFIPLIHLDCWINTILLQKAGSNEFSYIYRAYFMPKANIFDRVSPRGVS